MVEPLACLGFAKRCSYEQAGTSTRHDRPATTLNRTRSVCRDRNLMQLNACLSLSVLLLAHAVNSGEVTCYEYESSFYISYTIEPEGECAAWVASANSLIAVCSEDGADGTLICDRVAAASDGHAMIKTGAASGSVHLLHTVAIFLPASHMSESARSLVEVGDFLSLGFPPAFSQQPYPLPPPMNRFNPRCFDVCSWFDTGECHRAGVQPSRRTCSSSSIGTRGAPAMPR